MYMYMRDAYVVSHILGEREREDIIYVPQTAPATSRAASGGGGGIAHILQTREITKIMKSIVRLMHSVTTTHDGINIWESMGEG